MRAPPGLHIRDDKVEGVGPWVWIKSDRWAWDHPASEFAGLRDLILAHIPLERRKIIVQAGGCMGMYPRLWSQHFEMVYTFEPDATNFYCLVANNPSAQVVAIRAALGETPGFGSMHLHPAVNSGAHLVTTVPGYVPILTLDSFRFIELDALQLDCEGSEEGIIKGALKTIERLRPVIAIEKPTQPTINALTGLGYIEVGRTGTMPDVVFAAK